MKQLLLLLIITNSYTHLFGVEKDIIKQSSNEVLDQELVDTEEAFNPFILGSKVGSIDFVKERVPLNIRQLRELVNFHNKNYEFQILNLMYFENIMELKLELREILGSLQENQIFFFVLKDAGDMHLSLISLFKIEGVIRFVFFDSVGEDGKYLKSYMSSLSELKIKTATDFYYMKPKRQSDSFSCGLFVLNDLRFLARMVYYKYDFLRYICKDIKEANIPSVRYRTYSIEVPSFEFLIPIQSLSSIEKMKENFPELLEVFNDLEILLEEHSCYMRKDQKSDKIINIFIQKQWDQVESILRYHLETEDSKFPRESNIRLTPFMKNENSQKACEGGVETSFEFPKEFCKNEGHVLDERFKVIEEGKVQDLKPGESEHSSYSEEEDEEEFFPIDFKPLFSD